MNSKIHYSIFLSLFMLTGNVSALPTINDTLRPDNWLTAGPFPSGARESSVDVLYEHGGFADIQPHKGMAHHSMLFNAGIVKWKQDTLDEKGRIAVQHTNGEAEPEWEEWLRYKGRTFIRASNYAYANFYAESNARALVIANGVGRFRLNGQSFTGDFYRDGFLQIPVRLNEGKNDVLLAMGGRPNASATFKIIPVEHDIKPILADKTEPHLLRDEAPGDLYFGVPFVNTTEQWLRDVKVQISYIHPDGNEAMLNEKKLSPIGPQSFQHSAHKLTFNEPEWNIPEDQDSIPLKMKVIYKDDSSVFHDNLPVKEDGEPYNVTFLDKDSSVQFYSVNPPAGYEPESTYPMIFFLHGAGVDATGSNGFNQKDWAFIISPTNRRPYGFDWEKQGRINGLMALKDAKKRFNIDENRIYLTGHSMGGHGAWVMSTGRPDLFAAVGPSAAWSSFDIYTPFLTRKDHLLGNPGNLQMLKSSLQPTRTLSLAENLLHLPVYILHGGKDRSVPPDHPRLFFQRLSDLNYEVTYNEVPGKGHWWRFEDSDRRDCVDHEEMMAFFREHTRVERPKRIRFTTAGLSESSKAYWLEVLQRKQFLDDSRVEANVWDDTVEVTAFNVRKLALDLGKLPAERDNLKVLINGKEHDVPEQDIAIFFPDGEDPLPGDLKKSPEMAGPVRQAFYGSFALVYATGGNEEWQKLTYHQARRLAQTWWYRGNGKTMIVADSAVTDEIEQNNNLILFGNPLVNTYYAEINDKLPLRFHDNSITLGNHQNGVKYSNEDLSVKFLYPNPEQADRFIQVNAGTSVRGQRISMDPGIIHSAEGLPDYVIFDDTVHRKGFAGWIHAGYFDNTWQYSEADSHRQPLNLRD